MDSFNKSDGRDVEEMFKIISTGANQISEVVKLITDISMPNIPLPTMGGNTFWKECENVNGLRLQQHYLTKHYRIIGPPPQNIRLAWGSETGMRKLLKKLEKKITTS